MRNRSNMLCLQTRRGGFTLTEMLVATALVVLIMLMFAQIYGSAVGSIHEQRALANNDQKARIIDTTLRNDLQAMTYRQPGYPYGNVQGIVPLSSGDEPIIDPQNQRGYFYYSENTTASERDDILQFTVQLQRGQRGDATRRSSSNRFIGKAPNEVNPGTSSDNHPELDDGIAGNSQGTSSAAEICYFLRGGNLYRRVLLLRDPLPKSFSVDAQPTNGTTARRIFDRTAARQDYEATSFYRDFDYSATRRLYSTGGVPSMLWFHSVESLANDRGLANIPLAQPRNRFGFRFTNGASVDSVNGFFFGRFTLQECAHSSFLWPGQDPVAADDPYNRTDTDMDDTDGNFVIDRFQDETNRVAEDILLTNVEAFDVKAFDWSSQAMVDASTDYDTWHPSIGGVPPTRQFHVDPPTNTNPMLMPPNQWNNWNSTDRANLQFIRVPALNPATAPRVNNSLLYRRINSGGSIGSVTPEFPPVVGSIVNDGSVVWECIDNRIPLQAIRISVRFRDTGSGQPRQVTMIHSFVE